MEPQTAIREKCVSKVDDVSVPSFWFSTGHEAHHNNYQKPALFQKIIKWYLFNDNWQSAASDHTFIYLFDLLCPQRGTETHLSQVPSFFLSVPFGTGWKLFWLHPHMRMSQRKEKRGITAPPQAGRRAHSHISSVLGPAQHSTSACSPLKMTQPEQLHVNGYFCGS